MNAGIEKEELLSDEFAVTTEKARNVDNPVFETRARDVPRGFFANQFEVRNFRENFPMHSNILTSDKNLSNYEAHFEGTGPEIWRQTNGNVHGFVSGAGELCLLVPLG
jgi:cysteine synthase